MYCKSSAPVGYRWTVARQNGGHVGKLIGYAQVSTRNQDTDRQEQDLLAAGVRRDDLYVDHGMSGARASRPEFDKAILALHEGDILAVTTLDRLGRSTQMELEIKRERITDSVSKRRAAGKDLGGRRIQFTDSQIRSSRRLVEAVSPPPKLHGIWGCRGRRCTGGWTSSTADRS